MKPIASLLSLFAVVAAPSLALAQAPTQTTRTADYVERQTGGDQAVIFRDDAIPVGVTDWFGGTVRRPPGVMRLLLIRPRLSFVPELLKSTDAL